MWGCNLWGWFSADMGVNGRLDASLPAAPEPPLVGVIVMAMSPTDAVDAHRTGGSWLAALPAL